MRLCALVRGFAMLTAASAMIGFGGAADAQRIVVDTASTRGLTIAFEYAFEGVSNVRGGVRRGTTFDGAAEAELALDLQRFVRWPNASLFILAIGTHGGAPSELVGDVQGVSNLETPPQLRLDEAWLQQNLVHDKLSLLVGRYDLNTEFYRLQSDEVFLNSSFEMGPEFSLSGITGPSISPNTTIGVRLSAKPTPNVVWRAAVLDDVPLDALETEFEPVGHESGALIVTELSLLASPDTARTRRRRRFLIGRGRTKLYSAKIAIGGWYYTGRFPDLSDTLETGEPVVHRGSHGAYLVGDATVWSAARVKARTLTVFGQLGIGDGRVTQVGWYAGGGVSLASPFTARPRDEVGIAIAAARMGSHFDRSAEPLGSSGETTVELTYVAQLGSDFALQPDVQFVRHPAGTLDARNALVLAIRAAFSR